MTLVLSFPDKSFRSGKWSREEEEYAAFLILEFSAGTLPEVEEGISLRVYLSRKLRCNPKRISKKYEGTNYNGKQTFQKSHASMTAEETEAKKKQSQVLEERFEASAKDIEAQAEANTKQNLQRSPKVGETSLATTRQSALGVFGAADGVAFSGKPQVRAHAPGANLPGPTFLEFGGIRDLLGPPARSQLTSMQLTSAQQLLPSCLVARESNLSLSSTALQLYDLQRHASQLINSAVMNGLQLNRAGSMPAPTRTFANAGESIYDRLHSARTESVHRSSELLKRALASENSIEGAGGSKKPRHFL